MYLYKFTTIDVRGYEKHYLKFCRYPKKTKIYRQCLDLLNENEIENFYFSPSN